MFWFHNTISHIIAHWGYLATFGVVALEGFGFFFVPGETTLIASAIYAGETGKLNIVILLLAAFCGAVIGDNFSFWIGRFVMLLRAWESFLAGADAMPWRQFAPTNAAAILVWVCVWGLGAYALGQASTDLMERIGIGIFVVVCIILITGWIYFRRHEDALEAKADKALPGPLRAHRPSDLRPTEGDKSPASHARG